MSEVKHNQMTVSSSGRIINFLLFMHLSLQKARFIPYSRHDVIRLLLDETQADKQLRDQLEHMSNLLVHLYHFQFHQTLETLKNCYAPINPDIDTHPVFDIATEAMQAQEAELFKTIDQLLDKANFEKITDADIQRAMEDESLFSIKLDIDFDDFEKILFFRRGESVREETVASWFGLRKKTVTFVNYDRVVVIVKFKPQSYFDANDRKDLYFKPGSTIVKLFRNIPRNDLEMLFPNTEVRMKPIDKVIIGVPALIGGLVMLITKLGTTLLLLGTLLGFWLGMHQDPVELNQTNLLALGVGFGTLGAFLWKQFSNFKNRKIRFMKTLADNLYFKNLDNNLGVFHRLIDAAEEEECKEAILAYYFLHQADQALDAETLDAQIEAWFEAKLNHALDFEVDDALQKLEKLGLVTINNGMYQAITPDAALTKLDAIWDGYFKASTKSAT